jgi:hypothetical protein
MKKLILLFLLTGAFVWSGCSKKSDITPLSPATATVNDLVGKWEGTKVSTTDTINNKAVTTTSTLKAGDLYIKFKQDKTGNKGGKSSGSATFTYTVSGGIVTLTSNSSAASYTILSITNTALVLRVKTNNEEEDIYLSKHEIIKNDDNNNCN